MPFDRLGAVTLAVRILDQDHLAGADDAGLAVAGLDGDTGVEIDDVLPARRGMPFVIVGAGRLAEDDAGRRQGGRGLAAATFVLPLDLDVAEVGLAVGVDIQVMDAHEYFSPLPSRQHSLERKHAEETR